MRRTVTRVPRIIRLAMICFPEKFRSAFAGEMVAAYLDGRPRGKLARWGFTMVTAAGLVRSGLQERIHPSLPTADSGGPGGGSPLPDLLRDFRVALRSLVRQPVFAVVSVMTLALGIGANAAIFSVIDAVLLKPLPYYQPERLVMVWAHDVSRPETRGSMSQPDIDDADQLPALESLVAHRSGQLTVVRNGRPLVVPAGWVVGGLMEMLAVRPLMGRDLTREDAEFGNPLTVVVSHRFWQRELAGDPDVLGTTLAIASEQFEIIGVAPPEFDYPSGVDIWVPRRVDPESCGRGCHIHRAIGRLAGGATVEELQTQLNTLAAGLESEYPESNTDKRFRAVILGDDLVGDVRAGLWLVLGAVGLVLLIACANVANLLLTRAERRRGEVAVRAALGASRSRLAMQVVAESIILAAAGVVAGLAVAWLGIEMVRLIPEGSVPRIEQVALDYRVLLFSIGTGLLVVLLFGLSPALALARLPLAENLVAGRRGSAGNRSHRFRNLLLASEVALSLVLLSGAGLLLKSFDQLYRIDLGFSHQNLTRFSVNLPDARYDSLRVIAPFFEQLEANLAAIPGVERVGSSFGPPLGWGNISGELRFEGQEPPAPGQELNAAIHSATPGYLATMQIPLIRGRWFGASDREGSEPVAVVNEALVREAFPDDDPIGKRIRVTASFGFGEGFRTIIGVVGDVPRRLTADPAAAMYVPHAQFGPSALTITVRNQSGAGLSVEQAQSVVAALDPEVPVQRFETFAQALRQETAPTRFYLTALGTFAALALILAAVGLYGVVSYLMAQRTQEIGVRMALGANRSRVVRLVLRQGLAPTVAGVVVGLAGALLLGRTVQGVLYQVTPYDPAVLVSVVASLLAVAALASLLPARRATLVDPVKALREE